MINSFVKTLLAEKAFQDSTVYYYFFSTVVQGFLTLVAFLGAFVVFKLQILHTEFETLIDKIRNQLVSLLDDSSLHKSTDDEIAQKASDVYYEKVNYKKADANADHVKNHYPRIEKSLNKTRIIREGMILFSIISFLNVGLSLAGIPLSKYFLTEPHNISIINLVLLIICFIFSILSLLLAYKLIKNALA